MNEHYSGPLRELLENMSIDNLVRESIRNPFAQEVNRRLEAAEHRVNQSREALAYLQSTISEAQRTYGEK